MMKPSGLIYQALHIPSGHRYHGKTTKLLEKRKREHFKDVKNGSQLFFHRALRKYSDPAEWQWTILVEGLDKVELNVAEKFFIAFWRSDEPEYGFNLTKGGEGGWPSRKGKKHSDKTKQKISASNKGKNKGKKLSKEHKQKISKSKKGKIKSEEHKKKISKSHKGKKKSEETKQKLSKSRKGKKWCYNPSTGESKALVEIPKGWFIGRRAKLNAVT